MILKKNEYFLLIFLIFLQSCSGGKIGNFLENSFSDLEKISLDKDSEKIEKVEEPKTILENYENKEDTEDKDSEKIEKVEEPKTILENNENKEDTEDKDSEKIEKVEEPKTILENYENKEDTEDKDSEKIEKLKNKKIKNYSKNRKIELQSYKIIFILKDVDPQNPTEELSSILSNYEVNFEIEKIERIFDSKNKSMNEN